MLRDVSFRVEPGQTIAIVGHTGAGKTTIIQLLLRFYEIQRGQILLDGIDIRELNVQDLRRQFGIVLQDPFLFTGTLESNVRLGTETRRPRQAVEPPCAKSASGLSSIPCRRAWTPSVSERGSTFSVGQRQLVSFARALAHNPRFLILDEATSSVDTSTEMMIREALDRLLTGRTAIVIAHRLSTIQHADRILVFHKGRLREQGTHQELLAQRGIYYRLYQLQYKDQELRLPCGSVRDVPAGAPLSPPTTRPACAAASLARMPPTELLISAGEASGECTPRSLARRSAAARRCAPVRHGRPADARSRRRNSCGLLPRSAWSALWKSCARCPRSAAPGARLLRETRRRRPALAILTDFPGFHLRLLARSRRKEVRNVYFVCPQFWAWRPWRVNLVRRRFVRGLCIFPFEVDFYRKAGVRADWIGHPWSTQVRATMTREEFAARHGLDAEPADHRAAAGQPPRRTRAAHAHADARPLPDAQSRTATAPIRPRPGPRTDAGANQPYLLRARYSDSRGRKCHL